MLFNEPKLLKLRGAGLWRSGDSSFSALQRAEIAEKALRRGKRAAEVGFSALQRAEIAENVVHTGNGLMPVCFSALQRAEIAEKRGGRSAEHPLRAFQCSSTSRNC